MNRRSFFTSLAKAAAIVALAPQLAFRVKPEEFSTELGYVSNCEGIYAQLEACGKMADIDPVQSLDLDKLFAQAYAIKRTRNQEFMEFYLRR